MIEHPTPNTEHRTPRVHWGVKAFVAFHLFCITVWAIPNAPAEIIQGKRKPWGTERFLVWNGASLKTFGPLKAYLFGTGFWQYWDMFSPNPAQTDFYGDADVVYQDGTKRRYQYPRMYLLPIHQKYPSERFRKFYERAHSENHPYLWRQFAHRIALLNAKDPKNPPVKVVLRRHWRPVARPGQVQQIPYNEYEYFQYAVDQAQLRKDLRR
jgi:hypothetical protein